MRHILAPKNVPGSLVEDNLPVNIKTGYQTERLCTHFFELGFIPKATIFGAS